MNIKLNILIIAILISFILVASIIPIVAIIFIAITYFYFLFKDKERTITLPPSPIYIGKEEKQYYLASTRWLFLKSAIRERDKVCVACGNKGTEVHHLTYKNWKNEPLSDLVLLCRNCHQTVHDQYGYDHNNEYPVIYKTK